MTTKNNYDSIIKKAVNKNDLSEKEIETLLNVEGEQYKHLCNTADRIREKNVGDKVYLRGIIEFSNYCDQNCNYCGLRKENKKLQRYKLSPEEIVEMAADAYELGYKTIVLQSGEDKYSADKISWIIKEIKNKTLDSAITLCLGEREYDEYEEWYAKGADRYLLKHETSDPELYKKLHPEMSYKERIDAIYKLKEIGYQIGSGNMIGLPGQSLATIASDIKLFKEMDLDMVGIGPFVSHPETPLSKEGAGSLELTLKAVAVTRLLLPLAHIPATTALGTIDDNGRQKALMAGANIVMPNVTKGEYREYYQIYPDKICVKEEPDDCRNCIGGLISSLNRIPAAERGDSFKM